MAFVVTYVLLGIVASIYLYLKWKLNFWKRQGLESVNAGLFEIGGQFDKIYKHLRGRSLKHGGTYMFSSPRYVPVDLDIIRDILIKNFNHFINHGIERLTASDQDPLSEHLFNLTDDKWRFMRAKLSPTFTSGKMKMMFNTMVAATDQLIPVMEEYAKISDPVLIKDVLARLTTDIIGSVGFGLEINSLKNPDSDFRKYGKKVFENVPRKLLATFILPKSVQLYLKERDPESVEKFFVKVVKDTVAYREKNNVHRNDFLHLLLQLKNRGQVSEDNSDTDIFGENKKTGDNLTINQITAQCFVFFLGGFETSSTLMNFALFELAINPEIQERLREEILTTLKEDKGKIIYDSVMNMPYLEKVINETLRTHPPVSGIMRVCNKDYPVPGTDYVVKSGTHVVIPTGQIQMDPEYYPNPEQFNPEHFNSENKGKRHPMAFLPFGEGPRMCIGSRFGMLQAKVGLIAVLSKFRFTLSSKTKMPLEFKSSFLVQEVKGGIWLNVEKI